MAAHWHILLPYEIAYEDKPEMQLSFETQFKPDFLFEKIRQYQVVQPAVQVGGFRVMRERVEKCYYLSPRMLREEFKGFYRFFLNEFYKKYYTEHRKFNSDTFERDLLQDFLRRLDDVSIGEFNFETIDAIESIDTNYFLHFDMISPLYVQEGYPLPMEGNSQMAVVSLLHSFERMNMNAQETVAFHNFMEHIKKIAKEKFRLAQYLFVAGY